MAVRPTQSRSFRTQAISFVFLCFFIRHSPFAADEVDAIVVSTQTCTLLTLMYALCIRIVSRPTAALEPRNRGRRAHPLRGLGRCSASSCRIPCWCLRAPCQDFFAAEGISDNTMAVGMLIIQTAPLLIALIVIGWLFKSVCTPLPAPVRTLAPATS